MPRLPHVAGATSDEAETSAHVGAPFACSKDVQLVGRVVPRENEGRLAQTKRTKEGKKERGKGRVDACAYRYERRKEKETRGGRQGERGIHLAGERTGRPRPRKEGERSRARD